MRCTVQTSQQKQDGNLAVLTREADVMHIYRCGHSALARSHSQSTVVSVQICLSKPNITVNLLTGLKQNYRLFFSSRVIKLTSVIMGSTGWDQPLNSRRTHVFTPCSVLCQGVKMAFASDHYDNSTKSNCDCNRKSCGDINSTLDSRHSVLSGPWSHHCILQLCLRALEKKDIQLKQKRKNKFVTRGVKHLHDIPSSLPSFGS